MSYRGHTGFSPYNTDIDDFPSSALFRLGGLVGVDAIELHAGSTRDGIGKGLRSNSTSGLTEQRTINALILPSIAGGGAPSAGFPMRYTAFAAGNQQPLVMVTNDLGNPAGISVQVTPAGFVRCVNNSGVVIQTAQEIPPLIQGQWYYFEVTINNALTTLQLWVDGQQAFTSAVSWTAVGTVSDFRFGQGVFSGSNAIWGGTWEIEHIVMTDSINTGDGVTTRLGDGKINYIEAIAEVGGQNTGYTRTGGASINAALSTIDADTSYYAAATDADQVIFSSTQLLGFTPTVIHAVQVEHQSRKTDVGVRTAAAMLRSGGNNFTGSAETMPSSYSLFREVWTEEPDGSIPWTKSLVEAADFGVTVIS